LQACQLHTNYLLQRITPNGAQSITGSMQNQTLTNTQTRFLKSLAHSLKPVVRVGQHGLSEAVLAELSIALNHHELVKVKVAADDKAARDAMLDQMLKKSDAVLVQRIGNMVVLYKQNKDKPVIDLKIAG